MAILPARFVYEFRISLQAEELAIWQFWKVASNLSFGQVSRFPVLTRDGCVIQVFRVSWVTCMEVEKLRIGNFGRLFRIGV